LIDDLQNRDVINRALASMPGLMKIFMHSKANAFVELQPEEQTPDIVASEQLCTLFEKQLKTRLNSLEQNI
jgi:hypothetical protein